MSDCKHQIDLCPDCDGLRVTRLDRIEGITSIRIDGPPGLSGMTLKNPVVYGGPVRPCPNPTRKELGDG
ncbi:hypothetical protein [Streptomyces sp. NPDC047070]|uniref:hypothetical protein n=1 Tax=Streptomyces sp. NPDC047070 TaxID=3154923 RepID=UPI00345409F6